MRASVVPETPEPTPTGVADVKGPADDEEEVDLEGDAGATLNFSMFCVVGDDIKAEEPW